MPKILAVVMLITMTLTGLIKGEPLIITESAVVKAALENNPALGVANKMADAADAASHKELWLPNPMAGIEYMGVADSGVALGTATGKNLTVSQVIPLPFKYFWKIGAAVSRSDYARYMAKMKEQEVISNARQAFYELYKINMTIVITQEACSIVKEFSEIAFAKYNSGGQSQQDVLKADIENQTLQNELQSLKRLKQIAIEKVEVSTNWALNLTSTVFDLAEPELPVLKNDFDKVKEHVLANSPIVKAAVASAKISENMSIMAISDYIPDLKLTYKKMIDPNTSGYSLMAEAEIPLWFLNNQQADIGEKGAMAEAGKKDIINISNNAVLQAREHYEIVNSDFKTLELYKNKLIPQLQAAVMSMTANYKSKKADFMELLDSQRMLLEMQKDYYMKMEEYLMHYRMLEELTEK